MSGIDATINVTVSTKAHSVFGQFKLVFVLIVNRGLLSPRGALNINSE